MYVEELWSPGQEKLERRHRGRREQSSSWACGVAWQGGDLVWRGAVGEMGAESQRGLNPGLGLYSVGHREAQGFVRLYQSCGLHHTKCVPRPPVSASPRTC